MINKEEVEEEQIYENDAGGEIKNPFDPKDVDIITLPMVISNIVERLQYGAIELTPDFQRLPGLWDDVKQSRLIESLIIRIPLPSFYFDYTDDEEKLAVVDGQQRLYAMKRFMALEKEDPDRLRLKNLEYLTEYEGALFEDLPLPIQRRIREQSITSYVIRSGTPSKVRTSIFQRINTGGLTLEKAEIRNSVYRGQAADLLKELAHSEEFKRATRGKISPLRMVDCEFVNRTLAFYLLGVGRYDENFDDFMETVLVELKDAEESIIDRCRKSFLRSMKYSYEIFGENAFRKLQTNKKYGRINKPLYESVSVNIALLTETQCEKLLHQKDSFLKEYESLLMEEDFSKILSGGTGKKENVKARHERIKDIIRRTLQS